ncbi:MAG TPA: hypothetical protein VL172_17370 [Kofleriaceae bacterium]|jgi:hypothetical protein|nr:hypothetical protein [Kofleriaceae bacterium]
MRVSLSYLTSTAAVSRLRRDGDLPPVGPHTLDPLGYDHQERRIYLLEHYDDESADLPQLHVLHAHGAHGGRMVPLASWGDGHPAQIEGGFESRLADLRASLADLRPMPRARFAVTTRVVKRRALRLYPDEMPIRKYTLRINVRALGARGVVSIGATTEVDAYLRPRARLVDVYRVPGERLALAVVSWVGIPFELGHDKQTALLVPCP